MVKDGELLAGRHAAPELDVLRPEPEDEPDHEELSTPFGRRDDPVGVLEREGDRFLEEDVLLGREGPLGDVTMKRRRQANVDGVDLRVAEDVVELGGQRGAQRLRDLGGALARARAHPLDANAVAELCVISGVRGTHEAPAEYGDADHLRLAARR